MKTIENLQDLNNLLNQFISSKDECILRVYDNKSDVLLQSIVVNHPVIFIRGIQDFCKSVSLPVSDLSVNLVGFILEDSVLKEINDIVEISPYIYFKKPDENDEVSEEAKPEEAKPLEHN